MTLFYGCIAIIAILSIYFVIDTAIHWNSRQDKGFLDEPEEDNACPAVDDNCDCCCADVCARIAGTDHKPGRDRSDRQS